MEKILVSACLLGKPVRYDGRAKSADSRQLSAWQQEGRVVGFCPEIEAGLPVPRPPAEIADGRSGADVLAGSAQVIEDNGRDVSEAFIDGARKALAAAQKHGCRYALLTDGSPSCGSSFVYDGSFSGKRSIGPGVVTALLRQNGIEVYSENQIGELAQRLGSPGSSRP